MFHMQLMNGGNTLPRADLLFYARAPGMVDSIGLLISDYTPPTTTGIVVKPDSDNPTTAVMYKVGNLSNSSDADASFTHAKTLQQALTAAGVGGHLYACSGTYTGTMVNSSGGLSAPYANQKIICADGAILDCSLLGTYGLDFQYATLIYNLWITGSVGAYHAVWDRGGCIFINCRLYGGVRGVRISTAITSKWLRCWLSPGSTFGFEHIAGTLIASFCDFDGLSGSALGTNKINATATFNNCLFRGFLGGPLMSTSGTHTVTINNPIFFANAKANGATPVITPGSANFVINNGITLGNSIGSSYYGYVGVTKNNCLPYSYPKFKNARRPAVIVPCIDDWDAGVIAYTQAVFAKLDAYGWKGTLAVPRTPYFDSSSWLALKAFRDSGHELANHTTDHCGMTSTSVFTLQGAVGETASSNGTTLTTSTGKSYTLASYANIGELRTDLLSDGYTVGLTIGDTITTRVIDTFTNQSIATAYSVPIDLDTFYYEEVTVNKETAAAQGVSFPAFVPPGNVTTADLRDWLMSDSGHVGARGNTTDYTLASYDISQVNIVKMQTTFGDTTAAEGTGLTRAECVKIATAGWLSKMQHYGMVIAPYAHNTTEFSYADWDAFLEVVADFGIEVMTLSEAIEYIKTYDPSADLASADGKVYTRTLLDESDYTLTAGSPCISAGVSPFIAADGDQYDADGHKIYDSILAIPDGHWIDGPDIGAYAYGSANKVYTGVYEKSAGVFAWRSIPELITRIGVDNAVYNADSTGKEFASKDLALAAMASLADDEYLFGGEKGVALYSVNMSAKAGKIKKILADAD